VLPIVEVTMVVHIDIYVDLGEVGVLHLLEQIARVLLVLIVQAFISYISLISGRLVCLSSRKADGTLGLLRRLPVHLPVSLFQFCFEYGLFVILNIQEALLAAVVSTWLLRYVDVHHWLAVVGDVTLMHGRSGCNTIGCVMRLLAAVVDHLVDVDDIVHLVEYCANARHLGVVF